MTSSQFVTERFLLSNLSELRRRMYKTSPLSMLLVSRRPLHKSFLLDKSLELLHSDNKILQCMSSTTLDRHSADTARGCTQRKPLSWCYLCLDSQFQPSNLCTQPLRIVKTFLLDMHRWPRAAHWLRNMIPRCS